MRAAYIAALISLFCKHQSNVKVKKIESEYYKQNITGVSLNEYILQNLDISENDLANFLSAASNLSLNQAAGLDDEGTLSEIIPSVYNTEETVIEKISQEEIANMINKIFTKVLTPREEYVVKARYGFFKRNILCRR